MPDDRPRPFSWLDYFPWLRLGRSLRSSLSIRVLLAAVIGYVGTKAGWRLIGMMFDDPDEVSVLQSFITSIKPWPWETTSDLSANPVPGAPWIGEVLSGPLTRAWMELTHPFQVMFHYEVGWTGLAYAILCGLWMLVVWSFFGGIITRTAALRFARNETPTLGHCIRFTNRQYINFLIAPLFPLLGIMLAAIPIVLLGLLAQSNFGAIVSGVLGLVMVLCALFMSILFVALAVGWPLMWATISTEGTDAFDALSRMYAYVYQRPVKLLMYLVVAAFLGAIGALFIVLLAGALNMLAVWAFSLGSGPERFENLVRLDLFVGGIGEHRPELTGMMNTGSNLLEFWFGLVCTVVACYPIAFFWCAYTGIYALLRYDVDAAELDSVYLDEQQASFGLPHLATDSAGVPLATDSSPDMPARPSTNIPDSDDAAQTDESNGDVAAKE